MATEDVSYNVCIHCGTAVTAIRSEFLNATIFPLTTIKKLFNEAKVIGARCIRS